MGGKGSGRKDRTTELLSNTTVQKFNPIGTSGNSELILPNHSGISIHPEMLGAKGFVKKTGDTMTGNLINTANINLTGEFSRIGLRTSSPAEAIDINVGTIKVKQNEDTVIQSWLGEDDRTLSLTTPDKDDDNTPWIFSTLNSLKFVIDSKDALTITPAGDVTIGDGTGDILVAGSTEANLLFTKSSDNRVGIGTNTPSELLDVDGDMCVTGRVTAGASTTTGLATFDGDIAVGDDIFFATTNAQLQWTDVNLTNIKAFKAGDGTDARMDFNVIPADGTSNAEVKFFRTTNTTGGRSFTINKGDGTNTVMFSVDASTGNITAGDGSGDMTVAGSSVANLLFTKSDDNRVGIGTNTPAELLDVDGNACIAGTLDAGVTTINSDLILDAGSITSASGAISFGNENLTTTGTLNSATITTIGLGIIGGDLQINGGDISSTSGSMRFTGLAVVTGTLNAQATTITGDLTVDSAGNTFKVDSLNNRVGIGTYSPTAVVQVGSTDAILINPTGTAQLSTLAGNAGGLRSSSGVLTVDSAAAMVIDYNTRGLTGGRHFTIKHDNTGVLTILGGDSFGNVGIGTAAPSTKLEVAGSGLFTGGLLTLGVEDSVQGRLVLHGSATGEGGEINLKLPGDSDSTFQHWVIDVPAGDDLRIFTSDAAVIHTFSNSGAVTFNGNIVGSKTSSDVEIIGQTTNADARLVLRNTGNGRHSGIQLIRERLSGTGMTAASIFVNSDTSTNNTQLIIQCNSSTNIGSLGATDQRIVLDSATDTMDIDNCGVMIQEIAAAKADKAGYGQIWVKNTTPCELWFTDDTGTDTQIV
jgi:hypothetical protein